MAFLITISGAGNRFLLVDKRWFGKSQPPAFWSESGIESSLPLENFLDLSSSNLSHRKAFLNKLLSQKDLFNLTDGLIVLRESKDNKVLCDFYNKDGSQADMCGNAACCLAFYFNSLNCPITELTLGSQTVFLDKKGAVILQKTPAPPQLIDQPFPFYFIDTGVPHGVILFDEIPLNDIRSTQTHPIKNLLKEQAQALRSKNIPPYKEGMNVSFYQVLSPTHLKACSFERGVEDFTLACGTGALAVSLTHKQTKHLTEDLDIKIEMPGGTLKVEIGQQIKLLSQVKKGF